MHAIIAVGIAFGINPEKQQFGDILVSTKILAYEPQRIGTNTSGEQRLTSRGDRASASQRLINFFRHAQTSWTGASVSHGLMLTGEKLIDNELFRATLTFRIRVDFE